MLQPKPKHDSEALKMAYEDAKKQGYSKDINTFHNLLKTDKEALNMAYKDARKQGYGKSIDDFQNLFGVEKKNQVGTSTSTTPTESTASVQKVGSSVTPKITPEEKDEFDTAFKSKPQQPKLNQPIPGATNFDTTATVEIKNPKPISNQEFIDAEKKKALNYINQVDKAKSFERLKSEINDKEAGDYLREGGKQVLGAIINPFADMVKDIYGLATGDKTVGDGSRKKTDFISTKPKVPLASQKEQAEKEFRDKGVVPPPSLLMKRAEEIFLEEDEYNQRESNANDYFTSGSPTAEEVKKQLGIDQIINTRKLEDKARQKAIYSKVIEAEAPVVKQDYEKAVNEYLEKVDGKKVFTTQQEVDEANAVINNLKIAEENLTKFNKKVDYHLKSNLQLDIKNSADDVFLFTNNYNLLDKTIDQVVGGTKTLAGNAVKLGAELLLPDYEEGVDSFANKIAETEFVSKTRDVINDVADEVIKEGEDQTKQYRRITIDKVNSVSDMGRYAVGLLAEQTPILASMMIAGKPGLTIVSASSGGNAIYQMEQESKKPFGRIYTNAEKLTAGIGYSLAEYFPERYVTLPLLERLKKSYNSPFTSKLDRELFTRGIFEESKIFLDKVLPAVAMPVKEGLSEVVTGVLQEDLVDVNLLGKPKQSGAEKRRLEEFIAGAVVSGGIQGLQVLPSVFGAVIRKVSDNSSLLEAKKLMSDVDKIKVELERTDLSIEDRKILEQELDSKLNKTTEVIQKSSKKAQKLGETLLLEVLDINSKSDVILGEAKVIRESNISKELKKQKLDELGVAFKKLQDKKEGIINGGITEFDLLPKTESDKLKKQAKTELTQELNPDGTKNIEIKNEQITERANKFYAKQIESKRAERAEKKLEETKSQAKEQKKIDEIEDKRRDDLLGISGETIGMTEQEVKATAADRTARRVAVNEKYDAELQALEKPEQKEGKTPVAPELDIKIERGGVFAGDFLNDYDFLAEGSEHTVYRSKDGKTVIKIGEPHNSNETFQPRLEDALNINRLLGDGSLELIGTYRSPNGTINPVYKQNFIEGKTATQEQVAEHLINNGFTQTDKDTFTINKDGKTLEISDTSDNFIINSDSKIIAIDASIKEITNEATPPSNIKPDANIQPRVEPMGEVGIEEKPKAEVVAKEDVQPTPNIGEVEGDVKINQVVDALKQKFDFDVDVDAIKAKVEPKKKTTSNKAKKESIDENLNEFKKEQGKKSLLSRLAEGSSKIVKDAIKNISLNYEISKIEDARNLAKEIFQKLGMEEATIAVADKNSGIQGDVRAFLYQEVSNDITSRIMALREGIDSKSIEEFGFLQEALARIKDEMDMSSRDAGRFINALQYIYNGSEGEYALSKVVKKWESAKDEKIPDDLMEKFAETNKRIIELEKQLFELSQKKDKEDAQAELDNIISSENETKKKPAKKKYAVSKEKREERAKLKKEILKDYFGTLNDVTRFMTMLADPKVIKYLKMTLEENGGDFIDFSRILIDELGTEVRKYTKELFLKAGGQEADVVSFVNGPIIIDEDNNIHIPRSVLFDLINQGYTEIDALAEQIIEMLKEDYPDNDFTVREIRDAITKYGKITNPSEDEVLKQLGKMTRLGRLISQLEDAKSGQRPKKSGFQRLIPKTEQEKLDKDKERRIKREIDDILRDLNIPLTDAETEFFIKSQQDKIKTRLENEIRDLDDQIAKGEKRKNVKNPIEYSDDNKKLKDQRDAKKAELDALVGKPELTDEQKISRLEAFLNKNIERLEKQILTQTVEFKEKPTPLDSANLKALREKRDALRKEVDRIREEKGLIEERRLKNAKKARINKIADLKRRIKEKDFSKKERKPLPVDKELEKIQDELDGLKEVYATELYKAEVEKENKIKRVMKGAFYGISSLPRTVLASLDASFMMIQNGYFNVSYMFDDIVSIPKGVVDRVKEMSKLYKESAETGFVPFVKALVNSEYVNKSKFLEVLKVTAKAMGSAEKETEMRKQMQRQYYYNLAIKAGLQITRTDGKLDAKQEMYLNDIFVYALDAPGDVLRAVTKGKKYDPVGRKIVNLVRKAIGKEAIVGEKYDALEQTKNINVQRVTERGMVSMANHIMMNEFTKGAEALELLGKNKIDDIQDFKELASAINNLSGRSGLFLPFKIKGSNYYSPEGKVSGLLFFSYKLAATYVNTMNPFWHVSLGSKENFTYKEVKGVKVPVFYKPTYAQKLALKTMAKFFITTTVFGQLYAMAISGEDDDDEKSIYRVGSIETDPRSTNFGKIYKGNGIWIDPYVGKLQVAILMYKFFSGEEKNKYTGNITTIGKATENKKNRFDLLFNFGANKLSPAARIPYDFMTGEIVRDEATGKDKLLTGFEQEEFNLANSLVGNVPMYWTTLSDLAESEKERELYNNALYISLFSGYPGVSIDSKYKTTDYDIAKLKTEERERRNALTDLADDLIDKKITEEQANEKINKMYDGMLVKDMENAIKSVNSTIAKRGSEETALRIVNQNNKKAKAILIYDAYGDLSKNPSFDQINQDLLKLGYNIVDDEVMLYHYNQILAKKAGN